MTFWFYVIFHKIEYQTTSSCVCRGYTPMRNRRLLHKTVEETYVVDINEWWGYRNRVTPFHEKTQLSSIFV